MRRSLPLVLALCLAPLACTVNVNSGDASPPSDDAKPNSDGSGDDAGDSQGEAGGDDAGTGTLGTVAPAPEGGMPDCPADAGEGSYCTADGKLAGQWMMADELRIPEGAETLFEANHVDADRQPGLTLAVEGDVLYVKQISCGSCARIMGQGFRGELSSMSEEQIAAVQARLGLPEDTAPLTSVQRWRDFAGDTAGGEALTKLSNKTE